jgi:GT2 family glycosyltransferase
LISAVVINWNGRSYLERCLRALLAQVPAPDECIVVDNHSDDGSREWLAERFPAVQVIDTGSNAGPAFARNVGLEHAQHELVLCLDNDVELEPGALAALTAVLTEDPGCALVQARSVVADRPEVVHYDAARLHYLGTLVLENFFRARSEGERGHREVGAFVALAFLARRSVCRAVGGFDPDLFILYEDNDLSWRLRMHGWRIRLSCDAIARHAAGTAGLSFRDPKARYAARRAYLHARNRWLCVLQNMRWRTIVLTMPMQCLYAAVYAVFALTRGGFVAAVRGNFAAWFAMPRILRRRRLQRGRTVPDRRLLVSAAMTNHPGIADRGVQATVRRVLDAVFTVWWRVFGGLCG